MVKDLYEVLGVEKDADPAAIRKAYHRKALKHHPDRNGGSKESEETFREISAAYSILSDEKLRKAYDRERNRPAPQPAPGGSYTAPAPQGDEGWTQVSRKYEAVKNSYFWKASERRRAKNEQRSARMGSAESVFDMSSWDDLPGTSIQAPFDMTKPCPIINNAPVLGAPVKVAMGQFGTLPGFFFWQKPAGPNG